jgi:VanZ family protein
MTTSDPQRKRRRTRVLWALAVLWTGVILWAGSDQGSLTNTSRFLFPLIRWLMPDASFEARIEVLHAIRKAAHVIEYAILALLVWAALRSNRSVIARAAGFAIVWVIAIAACDELRQSLLASRTASIHDVAIDASGGALALAVAIAYTRWMQRARRPVAEA